MKSGLKILATAALLLLFILHASVSFLLIRRKNVRRRFAARNLARWSRFFLGWFNVQVKTLGKERILGDSRHFLIISNHLSYIDVLVIASQFPSLFITSVEIKETPGLSQICKAGGSYFVERRNRSHLRGEIESLGGALRDGVNLALFPEGTTGNGSGVMEFKKSLFGTAVMACAPILPLCIRYTRVNGRPLTPSDRDSVFYYGDMTFFEHFKRFIRLRKTEVELEILVPLDVSPESSRKELASVAHDRISSAYAPAALL